MTPLKIHNGGNYALMEYLICCKCEIFRAVTVSCLFLRWIKISKTSKLKNLSYLLKVYFHNFHKLTYSLVAKNYLKSLDFDAVVFYIFLAFNFPKSWDNVNE